MLFPLTCNEVSLQCQWKPGGDPEFLPGSDLAPVPLRWWSVRRGLVESQDFQHHPALMRPPRPCCQHGAPRPCWHPGASPRVSPFETARNWWRLNPLGNGKAVMRWHPHPSSFPCQNGFLKATQLRENNITIQKYLDFMWKITCHTKNQEDLKPNK